MLRLAHTRMPHRHLHVQITLIHQFDIKNQIGFRRNTWIRRVRTGTSPCTIGKLPRNEEPSLPADSHSRKTLVESRDQPSKSLGETKRLRLHPGLAVGIEFRLAVLVEDLFFSIVGRVELASIRGQPAGVMDLI